MHSGKAALLIIKSISITLCFSVVAVVADALPLAAIYPMGIFYQSSFMAKPPFNGFSPDTSSRANSVDLIEDAFEANQLIHMRIVIPRKQSNSEPYIVISPKGNPKPGFYVSRYIKALIKLQKQLPQGSTLRLFPTTTSDGNYLTCKVVLTYPDASGKMKKSQVLEIIRDWGTPGSASWLTDRIPQGNLVTNTFDNLQKHTVSLPAFNPVDAEMIEILAELVQDYLKDPDMLCENCNNFDFRDKPTPKPANIKQSGHHLAAIDAGGMVFYVDTFTPYNRISPRITLKKVAFKHVKTETMTRLDEQRMQNYQHYGQ